MPRFANRSFQVCDVGAGYSVIAEAWHELGWDLRNVTLIDDSPAMLQHSRRFILAGAREVIADAHSMPFKESEFDLTISSLGDPYNDVSVWKELYRVTRDSGFCIFSTPSFEWANAYRHHAHDPQTAAVFTLKNGTRLQVPSVILRRDEQRTMIESVGFKLYATVEIEAGALPAPLSSKVVLDSRTVSPVLTAYVAQKRQA